jgi:DNA-binding MarR family transcriptional regulator
MVKGYVANVEGRERGRARQVELTEAGRALLADDPLHLITRAIEDLDEEQRFALAGALEHIMRHLQADQAEDRSGSSP